MHSALENILKNTVTHPICAAATDSARVPVPAHVPVPAPPGVFEPIPAFGGVLLLSRPRRTFRYGLNGRVRGRACESALVGWDGCEVRL